MRTAIALLLSAGLVLAHAAHAAGSDQPPIAIGRWDGPLTIDGDLTKPAWQNAPAITLTQHDPYPGKPTPYLTTVRLLRDHRHVYIGISCVDPKPAGIVIHTLQRDGDQSNDDAITLVLDTFAQKKLAYVFQVNAGGAMTDGLISPGYTNPNTGSPVDYSWNGYWTAAVKHTAEGWTAEVDIDTQSLQFDSNKDQWGLNVSRYVPRDQLTLMWSGINLNSFVSNLQWEGTLTGVQGLSQGTGFEFDPYAVMRYDDAKHDTQSYTGFDLKYNLTPDLAGLFTYHTDFSEAQTNLLNVTLSPYPQSVTETRAFFLDGANVFTFSHNLGQGFIPFYSQSVGLLNGAVVPVDEGVKLLGHAGDWTLGMLDTQMAGTAISDGTNLFAGRAVYNVDDQWRVGTLLTHGDPTGKSDNTLTSFDTTWSSSSFGGDKNLNLAAWAARSSGDVPAGSPDGYGVDVAYPNDLWWWDANYNYYGSALDPAMGFVQRPATKQSYININYQPRPAADSAFSWVRQWDFYGTYTYVTGLDDHVQSEDWKLIPMQGLAQSGWFAYLESNPTYEVLATPYEIVPGVTLPAGGYHFTTNQVGVGSPRSNAFWVTLEAEAGGLYAGRYKATYPVFTWAAPGGKFSAQLQPALIWFYSREGDGIVRAQRLNLAYSFTPSLTLSSLLQYDNVSHTVSGNTELQWNIRPNRTLYVVWNHGLTLNPNLLQGQQTVSGNSAVVKLVWGFY